MRILITGICGFVGSELARGLIDLIPGAQICGLDNLMRRGSERNVPVLKKLGVRVAHGDARSASDFEALPPADWVIDASAIPSVLAGVDGRSSSRQLIEHNLFGTVNVLEYCRAHRAGVVLLSTSRVYSVPELAGLKVRSTNNALELDDSAPPPRGCSREGLSVDFSTAPPLSLYGASKLASETLALEYAQTYSLPVIVNRCGVLAGGGQFGTAEQGIFSYWIRAYASRRPLKYLGFNGSGHQVRDALHPRDLAVLLSKQMQVAPRDLVRWNVGGGRDRAMSLAQLSAWCANRFSAHEVKSTTESRRWDAPWIVMDHREVSQAFDWRPEISLEAILKEIAEHHAAHPDFLSLSEPA